MSTVRMTGLVSNMDTESIIKELMSAQSYKKTKIQNKITKLEWKQDKWKDINTKIYSLYTGSLSKLRLQGNYNTLKAASSDESKVTVTASNSAPSGTHTLKVEQLASGQYVTGTAVDTTLGGASISSGTKLSALGFDTGAGNTFTISSNGKTSYLDIGATTTVYDFTQACNKAGLNASYDTSQHRFFISSKESGTNNSFSITAESSLNTKYRNYIRDNIDYAGMSLSQKSTVDSALLTCVDPISVQTDKDAAKATILSAYENRVKVQSINQYKAAYYADTTGVLATTKTELQTTLKREPTAAEIEAALTKKAEDATNTDFANYTTWKKDGTEPSTQSDGYQLFKTSYNNFNTWYSGYVDHTNTSVLSQAIKDKIGYGGMTAAQQSTVDSNLNDYFATGATSDQKSTAKSNILSAYTDHVYSQFSDTSEADTQKAAWLAGTATSTNAFKMAETNLNTWLMGEGTVNQNDTFTNLGLSAIVKNADSTYTVSNPSEITYIASSNSKIILDNAELTGTSNTMTVNGMTFTLKGLSDKNNTPDDTSDDQTFNITISNDTDSVYNMIKSFVKSYNDVLSTLNKAYDAETAKGYEPLTDDQKEAMSDSEIEKWETKIKDSLLRRDGTIESLTSAMRTDLSNGVTVNGKKYSLASFGVGSALYTEEGQLHINGDSDDSLVSDQKDKLKAALESDPDTVTQVFSQLTSKLYSDLTDRMKSTTLRSALTFYNDKEMKKQVTDYKSDLSDLEDKLSDMEDRYYKQFSAMETAMAKLNSQSSSLTSMLG